MQGPSVRNPHTESCTRGRPMPGWIVAMRALPAKVPLTISDGDVEGSQEYGPLFVKACQEDLVKYLWVACLVGEERVLKFNK